MGQYKLMLVVGLFVIGLATQLVLIYRLRLCIAAGVILTGIGLTASGGDYTMLERAPLLIIAGASIVHNRGLKERIFIVAPVVVFMWLSIAFNNTSTNSENVRSALSLILLLFAASTPLAPRDARTIGVTIAFLPICVVAVGVLLQGAGLYTVFKVDFLHNLRLQGATIAAYLGAIALPATVLAAREASEPGRWRWIPLVGINLAILVMTGARMPLAVAVLCSVAGVSFTYFRRGKGGTIVGGAAVCLAIGIPFILTGSAGLGRFAEFQGGADYTSGRVQLWELLTREALFAYPFGHGIGAATRFLRDANLKIGTIAPHNEYIRFYYDLGLIGAVVVFSSIILVFRGRFLVFGSAARSYSSRIWVAWYMFGLLLFSLTDNVFTMSPSFVLLITLPVLAAIHGVDTDKIDVPGYSPVSGGSFSREV
jgi:hypothetical protein